jgi:MarR family transcriptional regulator, organic hydroperoxide resistance regulator
MSETSITETVSFLLSYVCKAHRNTLDRMIADLGLYAGQDVILKLLWHEDGQTQTQLAEKNCVQPATMSKVLSRMQEAGLIERRPDAEDSRVSRVFLTPRSQEIHEAMRKIWSQLEDQVTQNMTLEERALLRRLLLQVQENLN